MTDEQRFAHEQAVEDAKFDLKSDEIASKRFAGDWKQKNVTISEPQAQGMSQEQIQQYYNQANSVVDEFENISIPVGDKVFNFGLEEYKESLRQDLAQPIETLKRFGVDLELGTIDPAKFAELLLSNYALGEIGKPLTDWHLEQANAQTVRQQLNTPTPATPIGSGANKTPTVDERVAQAFQADREARRQSGN